MIRAKIWATYRPGQEVSKTPSRAYVEAAQAAEAWVIAEGRQVPEQLQIKLIEQHGFEHIHPAARTMDDAGPYTRHTMTREELERRFPKP